MPSDCLNTHSALMTSSLQAIWIGKKIVYLFLDTTSHILLLNFLGKTRFLLLNFPFSVTSITQLFFLGGGSRNFILPGRQAQISPPLLFYPLIICLKANRYLGTPNLSLRDFISVVANAWNSVNTKCKCYQS